MKIEMFTCYIPAEAAYGPENMQVHGTVETSYLHRQEPNDPSDA